MVTRLKKPLRVQLFAKPHSQHTGTGRYTENLARGLRQLGVDVRVTLVPTIPPWPRAGRLLQRLGIDVASFFHSYPLWVPIDPDVDLYHLTTQTMGTALMFQKFPRPVIITVLDIIPWLTRHDPDLSSFRHPVDRLFYSLALRGICVADGVIAISEYTRTTACEHLNVRPQDINVIYPGIDLEKFAGRHIVSQRVKDLARDVNSENLLFVGSDQRRKNVDTLLLAFRELRRISPNARILWVGQDSLEGSRVHNLVTELGLIEAVVPLGGVSDKELVDLYNLADVLVMPSLYEGFGLPVIEAAASGTTVVASNSSSLVEIGAGVATLVDPTDPEDLFEALKESLHIRTNSRARGHRSAHDLKSRYSIPRAAHETVEFYQEILARFHE